MAHIFDITASSESIKPDSNGAGEIAFTVSNVTDNTVKGRAVLGPEKSPVLSWLKLVGDQERLFPPKKSEQFVVKTNVPAGTKAGKYAFRLDAISVSRPDEDSTEGPSVAIAITLEPVPPKPFPWWILVVAVVVIGLLSYAAIKLIPGSSVAVPDLSQKNVADAQALLVSQNLKMGTIDNKITDPSMVDLVQSQTPAAATKVSPGSSINVVVGVAIVEVPPLKGKTHADAVQALTNAHLDLGAVTTSSSPGVTVAGQVLDSNPEAGNTEQSHTKIALVEQAGTVAVPDLTGQIWGAAQATLIVHNLAVGAVTGQPYRIVRVGLAITTVPNVVSGWSNKGQTVNVGTPINISFPGGTTVYNPRVLQSLSGSQLVKLAAPAK